MVGDIDIDNGHSFSYNVTIMFPALFQKQVVLSTFPVYDGINDNLIMDYHLDWMTNLWNLYEKTKEQALGGKLS